MVFHGFTKHIIIHIIKCMHTIRYRLELKDEFLKRTEKLTENENRIKGEIFDHCKIIIGLVPV